MVCPLMDARRNQTYTGLYRFDGNDMQVLRGECAVGIDEIAADINSRGEAVVFLGDGVPVFKAYLEEQLTVPHSYAPAHLNKQRAGAVAVLGMQYYREGKRRARRNTARNISGCPRRKESARSRKPQKERKTYEYHPEHDSGRCGEGGVSGGGDFFCSRGVRMLFWIRFVCPTRSFWWQRNRVSYRGTSECILRPMRVRSQMWL